MIIFFVPTPPHLDRRISKIISKKRKAKSEGKGSVGLEAKFSSRLIFSDSFSFTQIIGETSCKPQHSSTSQPSAIPYSTTSYNTIHFHTRPCHETPATMEIPPLTMSGQSHDIWNIMNLLKILNTYWKKTAASTQFADNSFGIPLPLRGKWRNIMNAYLKKTAASMQFANNIFGNGFTCTSCWYVVLQHLV